MLGFHEGYARLIDLFTKTADAHVDIDAALIIGSRARTDHPADEWSDLDMLVFVADPDHFAEQTCWYEAIEDVWLSFLTRTPGGSWERRVLFAGGLDVDFAIESRASLAFMATHALPPGAADLLKRGTYVLMDKTGLLDNVLGKPLPPGTAARCPDEKTFSTSVHDFWFHTLWTAKHLRRGELWWAKMGCDVHLKGLLNDMVKWHALASHGTGFDTWIGSRFIEEWADPCAVASFSEIFAHYDQKDIARALLATMDLYRWIAIATARRWNYAYPFAGERQTTALVEQLLTELQS